MSSSLKEDILRRIEEQKIEPKPRWQFIVLEAAWWLLVGVTLLLASFVAAVVWYRSVNSDVHQLFAAGVPWYQVLTIVAWSIAFLALFVAMVVEIKRSDRGYRHSGPMIAVAGILVVVGLSSILHYFAGGMVGGAERMVGQTIPYYRDASTARTKYWSAPARGRLIGRVVERSEDGMVLVVDSSGKEWSVQLSDSRGAERDPLAEVGSTLGLFIGQQDAVDSFHACGAIFIASESAQTHGISLSGSERTVAIVRTKPCAPQRRDLSGQGGVED